MNINELEVRKPYRITSSGYQFRIDDRVYLFDENMLVLQNNDEELHRLDFVSGNEGLAMTGMVGGFLNLSEPVEPAVFLDDDGSGDVPIDFESGMPLREFLLRFDKTTFVAVEDATLMVTKTISTLV